MSVKLVSAAEVIDSTGDAQPQAAVGAVRINLGCNQRPQRGYINVDIVDYPGVDVVADLEKRWPWEDGSVDEVACADLPEHIRQWWETPDPTSVAAAEKVLSKSYTDMTEFEILREAVDMLIDAIKFPKRTYGIIHFMNEAHRVLKGGGLLDCLIPSTDVAGRGAWQDPTHVSYWNESTLLYFCDMAGNFRGLYPALIKAKFRAREVKTYMPNPAGVTYLKFTLEKIE